MHLSLTTVTAWWPPCLFHAATGWACPLCGMSRGLEALTHGDVVAAVGFNPFAPLVAAVGVWLVARWVWRRVSSAGRRPVAVPRWLVVGIPTLLIGFTVVRNLPGMGALRP